MSDRAAPAASRRGPDGRAAAPAGQRIEPLRHLGRFRLVAIGINSVIGGGIRNPEDAEIITKRAVELGFSNSLGIIHDHTGSVKPLTRREERVYRDIKTYGKESYARFDWFQENLAHGKPNVRPTPA